MQQTIPEYFNYETVISFLPCQTPEAWIQTACLQQELLLIDHAHCEKKAAATALSFIHRCPDKPELLTRMSKIAREELVHFEQVMRILEQRGITYRPLTPSRYAKGLHEFCRDEPKQRFIDQLIIGAFIEARSCERFSKIASYLDQSLQHFYEGLLASEQRHFTIYLNFAQHYSDHDITPDIQRFMTAEHQLITSPDPCFRFHSGLPVNES